MGFASPCMRFDTAAGGRGGRQLLFRSSIFARDAQETRLAAPPCLRVDGGWGPRVSDCWFAEHIRS